MANDAAMVDVLLEFGADSSNGRQADVVSSAIGEGPLSLDLGRWSLAETTSAEALWATALGVSGAGDRTRTGDVQLGKLTDAKGVVA